MTRDTPEAARPDPDALLRQAEAAGRKSGRFKIFLGAAPGVGKTWRMLEMAQALRLSGVDVVVGVVETHGRFDTVNQLHGLPTLPRRVVTHRGVRLEAFDLDAALARRPAVLLLDELAHTNAPGGRHRHRHQDALELCAAGIEVWTTLNVQHLESLNDVVWQITGVRVRETVPDAVLARADEVELVDVPAEVLLARLEAGQVYPPAQAARAAQHFFKRSNLVALRELALRRTADRLDVELLAHRAAQGAVGPWAAGERVLVCVGPAPASARLVRAGARLAERLQCPWLAVAVTRVDAGPRAVAALEAHLHLAASLGAETVHLSGRAVAPALLAEARRRNVTRLIIGKPAHPRILDRLRGSLLDEVVRGSGDIEVHVISGVEAEAVPAPPPRPEPPRTPPRALVAAAVTVALTGALAAGLRALAGVPDVVMLFLLAVMGVAARWGRRPAILAAALSVATYDFFFVEPYLTFRVADARYLLTFGMLFGVGLGLSLLTDRLRRHEREARGREARTAQLLAFTRALAAAEGVEAVAAVVAERLAVQARRPTAVLLPGPPGDGAWAGASAETGALAVVAWAHPEAPGAEPGPGAPFSAGAQQFREGAPALSEPAQQFSEAAQGVARWSFDHDQPAGPGTDTLRGQPVRCLPLRVEGRAVGVLAWALAPPARDPQTEDARPGSAEGPPTAAWQGEEGATLDLMARQAAVALDRARLAHTARAAWEQTRSEQTRNAVLSAVSHDLRTPLAGITGAATALRDTPGLDEATRSELLEAVCDEAERMERLVANLLDMSRLEAGGLGEALAWVPLEELVGSALGRVSRRLGARPVTVDLPADLPLLSVAPVLFEQVFVNLLENIARHTPETAAVHLAARRVGAGHDLLEIEVADRGPGVPEAERARLFEKFFRGSGASGVGTGLGLAICRAIVEAHGGTLRAEDRRPGLALVLRLPWPTPPTEVWDLPRLEASG